MASSRLIILNENSFLNQKKLGKFFAISENKSDMAKKDESKHKTIFTFKAL